MKKAGNSRGTGTRGLQLDGKNVFTPYRPKSTSQTKSSTKSGDKRERK